MSNTLTRLRLHSFRILFFFFVEFDTLDLEIFVICWIGSVDAVEEGPWERGCLYSNILHHVIGNIWSCVSQILCCVLGDLRCVLQIRSCVLM